MGQLSNPETPVHSIAAAQDRAESSDQTTTSRREDLQRQTRLGPPQIEDLFEQRAAGATIRELADRFGIHRTTVMAHLRR